MTNLRIDGWAESTTTWNKNLIHFDMMICECGKCISDVEYIRYGGVCKLCWHKYNIKRNNK